MNESMRPTVTMSCTTSEASWSRLMMSRSSPMPMSGATMPSTTTSDTSVGQPHSTEHCQ